MLRIKKCLAVGGETPSNVSQQSDQTLGTNNKSYRLRPRTERPNTQLNFTGNDLFDYVNQAEAKVLNQGVAAPQQRAGSPSYFNQSSLKGISSRSGTSISLAATKEPQLQKLGPNIPLNANSSICSQNSQSMLNFDECSAIARNQQPQVASHAQLLAQRQAQRKAFATTASSLYNQNLTQNQQNSNSASSRSFSNSKIALNCAGGTAASPIYLKPATGSTQDCYQENLIKANSTHRLHEGAVTTRGVSIRSDQNGMSQLGNLTAIPQEPESSSTLSLVKQQLLGGLNFATAAFSSLSLKSNSEIPEAKAPSNQSSLPPTPKQVVERNKMSAQKMYQTQSPRTLYNLLQRKKSEKLQPLNSQPDTNFSSLGKGKANTPSMLPFKNYNQMKRTGSFSLKTVGADLSGKSGLTQVPVIAIDCFRQQQIGTKTGTKRVDQLMSKRFNAKQVSRTNSCKDASSREVSKGRTNSQSSATRSNKGGKKVSKMQYALVGRLVNTKAGQAKLKSSPSFTKTKHISKIKTVQNSPIKTALQSTRAADRKTEVSARNAKNGPNSARGFIF